MRADRRRRRAAQPRAESEHEFEALASDHARTVHLGVVEDKHGDAQRLAKSLASIEAVPLSDQVGIDTRARSAHGDVVGCGNDDAVADHSRQSDGGVRGLRHPLAQVHERLDEELRRERVGRGHALRLRAHGARLVDDGGLDATAATIDDEG